MNGIIGKLVLAALLLIGPETTDGEPLTLTAGKQTFVIPRTELTLPVIATPDLPAIQQWIKRAAKEVYVAPQNARWKGPGRYTAEINGKQLDQNKLMEQMLSYAVAGGPPSAHALTKDVYPKVGTELLTEITRKPIAYYATYFNRHNSSRVHNIRLAAEAIDSVVVFPGEVFSFNDTVGMRTTGKGYRSAPIIVRGELAEGIGGGICQVSSTLFNAVDQAGLQIVSRYSHSRNVSYVLPGRDATVSWNGPDFAFRNRYNQAVIIRATVAGGGLYVSLHSSDDLRYTSRPVPPVSRELPEELPSSEAWHKDKQKRENEKKENEKNEQPRQLEHNE